jgi:hypothetical protein
MALLALDRGNEETMRVMSAVLAALFLLVGVMGEAGAETSAKKHKRDAKKPAAVPQYASARSTRSDSYVERDANKLPFGSAIWWDQMQREGRLGGETP